MKRRSLQRTVYRPGTADKIHRPGLASIDGRIESISIRFDCTITYRILWWDGALRREEYLCDWEFTPVEDPQIEKVRIGFHG